MLQIRLSSEAAESDPTPNIKELGHKVMDPTTNIKDLTGLQLQWWIGCQGEWTDSELAGRQCEWADKNHNTLGEVTNTNVNKPTP